MRNLYDDWKADLGLRLCGLASCGVSCIAIGTLAALRLPDSPQREPVLLLLLLAGIGFLCASVGIALLLLGRHLFDQVEISQRWRTIPPAGSALTEAPLGVVVSPERCSVTMERSGNNSGEGASTNVVMRTDYRQYRHSGCDVGRS
jgi:hypothetical protein